MEELVGTKELYDINIRLNQPLEIGKRKYEMNETILSFERADIAQVSENKQYKEATGGYHNNLLIGWEEDKQATFSILNGVLSPSTWATLSNSKLNSSMYKSVPYKETVDIIEDDKFWFADLHYIPNHIDKLFGLQGNPDNEPMPMGRKPWLPLKPLPPSKDHFIFCYDIETGKRIMKFEVCGNRIVFKAPHNKVMVDYTFDYTDKIYTLEAGNRLLNGFLNLTGKMTVKDYFTGEPTTAILEIPRLRIYSSLQMNLGEFYDNPVVSNFNFIGYPPESRLDEKVFKITFLKHELTGEYV